MNIPNLFNQFLGASDGYSSPSSSTQGVGATITKLASNIPGGLAGGAAAGGILALLTTSKSARKFAGSAATYGGAALLGGLAYQAFNNWQKNNVRQVNSHVGAQHLKLKDTTAFGEAAHNTSLEFELTLVKAMIAAAKADGHIDQMEQQRIFKTVEDMDLPSETKGAIFDLLQKPVSIDDIARGVVNIEQSTAVYLASCLAITPDSSEENIYLDELAMALRLPKDLARQLQQQAQDAIAEAA
ncbi:tellurite resistance TerB family protein [Kaarinaea lacus]